MTSAPWPQAVAGLPGLRLEGLYTHFANADDPRDDYAAQQLEILLATRRRLAELGIPAPCCTPPAARRRSALPGQPSRPGARGHHAERPLSLRHRPRWPVDPAVTLRARVARAAQRIAAGDTVGYRPRPTGAARPRTPGPRAPGLRRRLPPAPSSARAHARRGAARARGRAASAWTS